MREQHMQFIETWAAFVRENPETWKALHTQFVNAQFVKHQEVVYRLLQEKGGKEKLVQLYNIQNVNGYSFLKE